jgi:hypothetical protein
MKGTIHKCIEKLVIEKFGQDKWEECLTSVGLDDDHVFMINDDVDEKTTMELITKAPGILGITLPQLMDAFGEYWVHVYAPKVYPAYYEGVTSSKQFLLKLHTLHVEITQNVPNARPPMFDYAWENDNTLLMTYKSGRGLLELFISLAKGLSTYFKDSLAIHRTEGSNTVKFVFG